MEKFFIYLLLIQQVNLCAVSIAFFISAGVRNGELANVLIILPFIISLVSSPFYNHEHLLYYQFVLGMYYAIF